MTSTEELRGRTQEERDYYSLSRRVYTIFAHVYDAVVFPFRKLRHEVASMVDLRPDARLLDVATGPVLRRSRSQGKRARWWVSTCPRRCCASRGGRIGSRT